MAHGGSVSGASTPRSLPGSGWSSRRTSMSSAKQPKITPRMESIVERAREDGSDGSLAKRAAEVPLEELASASSSKPPMDALILSREEMLQADRENLHPLRRLWLEDCGGSMRIPSTMWWRDRGDLEGLLGPCRQGLSGKQFFQLGGMWPRGEQEALAVQDREEGISLEGLGHSSSCKSPRGSSCWMECFGWTTKQWMS